MTRKAGRCVLCTRRPLRWDLCEHHYAVARHTHAGYPFITLNIDKVNHVKDRRRTRHGWTLRIKPMHIKEAPPCAELGPDIYFQSPSNLTDNELRAMHAACLSCPLLLHCREVAIAQQSDGWQAGLSERDRHLIRSLRGQDLEHSNIYFERMP